MGWPAANTVWLVCSVVVLSLAIGAPMAFAVVRTEIPGRRLALSLIAAMLFVPLYLQAAAWQAVWGVQGWLTHLTGLTPLEGWPAVIWIHTAAAIPWVVLIVGLGLDRVEPELEEDALLDASPGWVFWHVTLRRSLPAIGAAALWVAAIVSSEMTVTDLYQVRTLSEVVYLQYAAAADSEQATSGVLMITLVIAVGLAVVISAAVHRMSLDRYASPHERRLFPVGKLQSPISFFAWLALAVLAGVPIVGLVNKAGIIVSRTADGWSREWSLAKAAQTVFESPTRCSQELRWSLVIGITAASAAVVAGFLLAWVGRRRGVVKLIVIAIASLAMVMPGPLVGMGLIQLFQWGDSSVLRYWYDRTILAPVLAQFIKALPLATLVMWQAASSVPQELLDSAAVDGAGRVSVLGRVVLPLTRRSLGVAWLVAFAVAVGDLAGSILVLPPGVNTMANHVFGLIHYGVDDRVAGITLAMVGIFVLIGVVVR